MKAYRASAANCGCTASTPRAAAIKFFEQFPNKRKCDVIEGVVDGPFFTVSFGRTSEGQWPARWKDIYKKQTDTLPDTVAA